MDSGFHACGFRIPHPWIPDSITGWIPDFKILFYSSLFFSFFFFPVLSYIKQFLALPKRIVNIGAVSEVHWVRIVEEILTRKIYSYFNNNNGVNNNKRSVHCQNQCFSGSNIIRLRIV